MNPLTALSISITLLCKKKRGGRVDRSYAFSPFGLLCGAVDADNAMPSVLVCPHVMLVRFSIIILKRSLVQEQDSESERCCVKCVLFTPREDDSNVIEITNNYLLLFFCFQFQFKFPINIVRTYLRFRKKTGLKSVLSRFWFRFQLISDVASD